MASETSKEAGNDSKPGAVQYHDSALDHKIREVVPIPEEMEISIPVVPKYSPKTTSMRSPRSPGLSIAIARKMHIDHDITLPPSAYTSPLREELLSSKEQRNSFDDPEEARDSFSDIGPTSHLASSSVVFDFSSDDAGESLESDPASRDALHHHITSPGSSDGGDHYSTLGKNLFGKFWKKHFPKMNHHGDGELYRSHSGEHLTSVLANAGDSPTPEDSDDLMSPPSERALDASPRPRGQSHGLFDLFWQHRMDNENSVKHSHPRKSKSRRNQSSEDHGIKRNANSSDHLKHSKMDSDEEHHGRDSKSARDSKSDSRNLFENIFHPEHSSRRESSDGSSGGSSPLPSVSGHHFHTHITKKDLDDHKKKESISGRSGRTGSVSHSTRNASETSLDKYGFKDSVVGKGAQATVRLVHKKEKESKLYAIKEFRKRSHGESEKDYVKKVVAEFCISSSLHHENIVETLDLVQDHHAKWCVVMEYCPGGDLLHKMMHEGFSDNFELTCYFKQILLGIQYVHANGVVHRDLKPENLLLDESKRILKITDFGVAAVFRTQWEREGHLVHGKCGSAPYMPPEEWIQDFEYLPTKVDMWAVGTVFYSMLAKNLLWNCTKDTDLHYATYLKKRENGFPQFEVLDSNHKELLYCLLDPVASNRYEATQVLEKQWVKDIRVCRGEFAKHHQHL